jgi:hypothetical protein
VPSILINPFIKRNTVEKNPFEHCSIPSTIIKLFDLDECLNERVYNANTFENLMNLKTPRKSDEMPDPSDLQNELNKLKKVDVDFGNIDKTLIKNLLNKPHGITGLAEVKKNNKKKRYMRH